MTQQDLLEALKEGVQNGRIAAHLAAFIAAEVLDTEPQETDFDELLTLSDEDIRRN